MEKRYKFVMEKLDNPCSVCDLSSICMKNLESISVTRGEDCIINDRVYYDEEYIPMIEHCVSLTYGYYKLIE